MRYPGIFLQRDHWANSKNFLLICMKRTSETEKDWKNNKHIQPQPKFRCSNKKKRVNSTTCIMKIAKLQPLSY